MNDAELELQLANHFKRRWRILMLGLSIWGWLFIAVILFFLAAREN